MKRQDRSRLAAMMLAIVACGALPAAAQEQLDATQKLIQRIVKSAKGDADAAAKLLEAAKMLSDDPKVQVAACEAAYEYGIKAAGGYSSAVEALNILDKVDAKRAALWAERRTALYRLLYARATPMNKQRYGQLLVEMLIKTGNDKSKQHNMKEAVGFYRDALVVAKQLNLPELEAISGKLIAGVHLLQFQGAIDSLRVKLAENPRDKATRTSLIHMYLLGMNSPAEAAKHLSDDCDEALRKYVPLAAKPLAELKETDCLELARWYDQLIEKGTTQTSKANAAGHAVRYYHHFLSIHTAKDAMGVGGYLALKSLEERIKKMGLKLPSERVQGRWIDLLKLMDPARQALSGKWVREGGELTCECSSRGLITVPMTALGSYDLQVALTVNTGHEGSIILPVGAGHVGLILGGRRGLYSGLAEIDGQQLGSNNVTTIKSKDRQGPLRLGARALLDVRVRIKGETAHITAALDGKNIISWSGKQSSLGVSRLWQMPYRTFGLGSYASKVAWHSMKLKRIDPFERNLQWVSKNATYKPSSVYKLFSKQQLPLETFLTGKGALHGRDYAFHTEMEVNPYVVIDLKKPQIIRRIVIENRRGWYWQRMVGLAVSVSANGRTWAPIWRAAKVERMWVIDLKKRVKCRYVKIGCSGERKIQLGLAGVRIYATGD